MNEENLLAWALGSGPATPSARHAAAHASRSGLERGPMTHASFWLEAMRDGGGGVAAKLGP
jgi:hypothetical protein